MIIKRVSQGYSFKALVGYITHDKNRAQTSERVGWTATLNCRTDDPEAAARQMAFVAMNADYIKQQNGTRAGRKLLHDEHASHFSISFHETDAAKLTKPLMMKAAQQLLEAYGLENHQAVVAFHTDTKNPHLHVVANNYDWQTGKRVNKHCDHEHASRMAERFEKEHGLFLVDRRAENNRRRGEGERVSGEYEPTKHHGEIDQRKAATDAPRSIQPDCIPQDDNRKTLEELHRLQREDWREFSDQQKQDRSIQFMRHRADMATLWRRQREESDHLKAQIKHESGLAYDEMRKAAKPLFKKQWSKHFKERDAELRGFDHMGAISRAAYYLRRMRDGSGVRIEHGVLKTFFNEPAAMKTLRQELEEKFDTRAKALATAQNAAARAAAAQVWEKADDRFTDLYAKQKKARDELKILHEIEKLDLQDRQKASQREFRDYQQDERRAAGAEPSRYIRPADRSDRAQSAAEHREQLAKRQAADRAAAHDKRAHRSDQQPEQKTTTRAGGQRNSHIEPFARAAAELRKVQADDQRKRDETQRTDTEKTKAEFAPSYAAGSLAERFRAQAMRRAEAKKDLKKTDRDGKGRNRFDRERER